MGLLEVLTIVFIVLKLVGVVTWSWWIVFSPTIVSFAIYIVIVVGLILVKLTIKEK